jgi:hypothetical protein
MLKSTCWVIDTVHGQIPDRSPYIEAVSFLTQISCASVTDWMLIPCRERASILSLKPVNTLSGGSNGAMMTKRQEQ